MTAAHAPAARAATSSGAPAVSRNDLSAPMEAIAPANPIHAPFEFKPKPTRKVKPNIMEEIGRTLPAGLELYRAKRFQLGSKLEIVMLKMHVHPALEVKLKEWRQGLEDRFPLTSIFIRRVHVDQRLSNHLRSQFRNTDLLTGSAVPDLGKMITELCGNPPAPNVQPREKIPFREDFQNVPFVAIDRPDVSNPEDLIYGERKQDGRLILKVAIIDITDYIQLGSPHDKYALRVGHDFYGRNRKISTVGLAFSQDQGSFALGEARPAWVAELRISPGGTVEPDSFKLRRAWVKNHASIDPDKPFNIKAQPEIAPIIGALAEITRVLEQQRIKRSRMISIDGAGTASRIVAETMISANEALSNFIENRLKIDAGYIVHEEPPAADLEDWLESLHKLQIPASLEDLSNDWSKVGILRNLEESTSPLARSLENRILDRSMSRSVPSCRPGKHDGLNVQGYTRLKPREALGILNQLVLDAALSGRDKIPLDEIERRVQTLNDKRWTRDEQHYKLLFFEMLEEKLALVGREFDAEIAKVDYQVKFYRYGIPVDADRADEACIDSLTRIAWERHLIALRNDGAAELSEPPPLPEGLLARLEPTRYHVQVSGFSKLGSIGPDEAPALEQGALIPVKLKGFSLSTMRFEFEGAF